MGLNNSLKLAIYYITFYSIGGGNRGIFDLSVTRLAFLECPTASQGVLNGACGPYGHTYIIVHVCSPLLQPFETFR